MRAPHACCVGETWPPLSAESTKAEGPGGLALRLMVVIVSNGMVKSLTGLLVVAFSVISLLAACTQPGGSQTLTPTPTIIEIPVATWTATSTGQEQPAGATRLASHLFVPVGESRNIEGLGELVETLHFTDPASVSAEGTILRATAGGVSCLRFAYRSVESENAVQTLCVVSFDETGDCTGLEPVALDLQRFLGSTSELVGNANLLEAGAGLFYATCRPEAGAYRLQQPIQALPPLYFTIVDALADGPYSLGDSEMPIQRAGSVVTFSGDELRPPWIVSVGQEITSLHLADDLRVEFTGDDCSENPSCTYSPDVVRAGDILRISAGIPVELLETLYEGTPEELLDRFFRDRIGLDWAEVATVHPDARKMAFLRLVTLDLMIQQIAYFDGLYKLRKKGVVIGYWQPWMAQTPLPYPFMCFPDDISPGEGERCRHIEEAIQAEEKRRISDLRNAGYDLWYGGFIDYTEKGEYASFNDLRPHFSLFGGIVAGIGANSLSRVSDVPATLATVVREFAAEIGPDVPVVISLNGPPVTAQTGGAFCEAEICPSDFKGMYNQSEAMLHAALRSLTREQFRGFGVSLFEGAHFDIRQPYEDFPGFSLNRVGETGYNNPVLNIYRAR